MDTKADNVIYDDLKVAPQILSLTDGEVDDVQAALDALKGLGTAGIAEFVKTHTQAAAFNFPAGTTVGATYLPATNYSSMRFNRVTLPPAQGNVVAGFRMTYSNGLIFNTYNFDVASTLIYTADSLSQSTLVDGAKVIKVELIYLNQAGVAEVQTFGASRFEGVQV